MADILSIPQVRYVIPIIKLLNNFIVCVLMFKGKYTTNNWIDNGLF